TPEAVPHLFSIGRRHLLSASGAEVLGDGAIGRQKTLGMARGLEPLHPTLTLPRRPMGVFTPVIEVTTLTVFHPGQDLPLRRAIALQLIRDDDAWYVLQALEQLTKKLLGRLFVAPTLHQDVEDVIVLIHGPPQIMACAINRQKHLVQMPFVAWLGASTLEPIGVVLPKLPTPPADRFVGHRDAAFEQDLFHVAVAQGEAVVEPDPVADDFARKAVVLVSFAGGGRDHVWLPILEFEWSGRSHHQGNYVMGQEAGSAS